MAGIARGKIIYGDASGNPAVLTVGDADQVLISDGTDFSWAAAVAPVGYARSSFTTTPGTDGNFDLAKIQAQTGSAESGLTLSGGNGGGDAFGVETGDSSDLYDLMDPKFLNKTIDYGSVA